MKIFDIVKLNEALDIRPVADGYAIIDTETGLPRPGTIVYPDAGSAEEARDRIRAGTGTGTGTNRNGSTAGPATNRGTPPELDDLTRAQQRQLRRTGTITIAGETFTQQEINAHTERQRLNRSRTTRDADAARGTPQSDTTANRSGRPQPGNTGGSDFSSKFRYARRLLGAGGTILFTVALWNQLRTQMLGLYNARYNPEPGQAPLSQADYDMAVKSAFGAFVASGTVAGVYALSAGGRTIAGLIRWARGLNFASSAAMFAGGPVGIALGLVKFILFELATWAAAYYISTSETAQRALMGVIWNWWGARFFQAFEVSAQAVANLDNIVEEAMNGNLPTQGQADAARRDAQRLVGLRPEDIAQNYQDRNDPGGSVPANSQQPGTNNRPATSPGTTNPLAAD